jgi:hypothetical protein
MALQKLATDYQLDLFEVPATTRQHDRSSELREK